MNIHRYWELTREFEEYMQKRDPFFKNIKRRICGIYCVNEIEEQWQIWLEKKLKEIK